ncbi:hypothetical protein DVH05_000517 [Phytophthora capsici]|nr:hypothetical protein DVH05_000517 [Phytophthora capsici]
MLAPIGLISLLLLGSNTLADEGSGSKDGAVVDVGTGSETMGNNVGAFESSCGSCTSSDCKPLYFQGSMEISGLCGPSEYSYVQGIEISGASSDSFSYTTYSNSAKSTYYPDCTDTRKLCWGSNTYTCGAYAGDNPVVVITCNNWLVSCNLMYDITWGCASYASTRTGNNNDGQVYSVAGFIGLLASTLVTFYLT